MTTEEAESQAFAKVRAQEAVNLLGDRVNWEEWYDLDENRINPDELLRCDDPKELNNHISQVAKIVHSEGLGYIQQHQYSDIFELIEDLELNKLFDEEIEDQVKRCHSDYSAIVEDIENLIKSIR